jgi:hypothetical protein
MHNLKKFSAISRFKFTPAVHKDIKAKILPGYRNYRMRFSCHRGFIPRKEIGWKVDPAYFFYNSRKTPGDRREAGSNKVLEQTGSPAAYPRVGLL